MEKEIIEFFGFNSDEVKSFDDFKNKFNEKGYILKSEVIKQPDVVKSVAGKVLGGATTKVKQLAKEFEIELDNEEIKDKKIEDIIDIVGNKLKEKTAKKDNTSVDNHLSEYEEKIKKYKSEISQYKEMVNTMKENLTKVEEEKKNTIKSFVRDLAYKEAWSKINFSETVDDLKKMGFKKYIEDTYMIDVDDDSNEAFIIDKKSGKRVENKNKAGEFYKIDDLFIDEASRFKLVKQNIAAQANNIFAVKSENGTSNNEPVKKVNIPYSQRGK